MSREVRYSLAGLQVVREYKISSLIRSLIKGLRESHSVSS